MADIVLNPGEPSPSDIKLLASSETAGWYAFGAASNNSDSVGAQVAIGTRRAVASALLTTGFTFVPFNTPQASTIIGIPLGMGGASPRITRVYYQARFETPYQPPPMPNGWHWPLSTPPPVAQALPGFSFVPFNTAQLSVNFTNFGWHQRLSQVPTVATPWQGFAFVPLNTAQLSVNFTNFGWYEALSPAPAVGQAQAGDSFVPYNPATHVSGIPLDMGGILPQLRIVYAQARFDAPYAPTTAAVATEDPGGDYSLIPLYRRKKLEDELYEIELKLRDIALDIPLPGHSEPVIYNRPLLEPFSDKQQTISVLVSRRARAQAEYEQLLKAQQDDDDDSAILLLWP